MVTPVVVLAVGKLVVVALVAAVAVQLLASQDRLSRFYTSTAASAKAKVALLVPVSATL